MKKKVVITGANGMVGSAIVKYLHNDYDLIAIDRHNDRIEPFTKSLDGVDFVFSDILSINDWNRVLGEAFAVIHLAANVHWAPKTSEQVASFYKVNVEGTRILIDKCAQYGVKKFLFFSTNDVYPNSDHEIEESEPLVATSIYAKTKLEAEISILQKYGTGSLDVLILRPASIYGEHDRGSMSSLISLCKHGVVPVIGSGENVKALLYVKDVAAFVRTYIESEVVPGVSIANIASGNYSFVQIISTINDVFGLNGRLIRLPLFLKDDKVFSKSGMLNKLKVASESKKVNCGKIERLYGFTSSYDMKEGLMDSSEYYREFCKVQKSKK